MQVLQLRDVEAAPSGGHTLELGRLLGRGAFASVHKCHFNGQPAACKVLAPELWLPKASPWTQFKAEAQLLLQLDHRCV